MKLHASFLVVAAMASAISPQALIAKEAVGIVELAPGLLVTEFPRHAKQCDKDHVYLPVDDWGDSVGKRYVVKKLSGWQHDTGRNAVAQGFLKIEKDGDYAFITDSFYDRNLLMIDGKLVCGFADGGDRIGTISLKKGLVEILSAGFVEGRGGTQGISVRWRPPGQRELSEIPHSLLSHPPVAGKPSKKPNSRNKGKKPNRVRTRGAVGESPPEPAPRLRADSVTVVAKDFVIEVYKNGARLPDSKRQLLLDRFGATVERIQVEVRDGDWLVFHVVNNRLRHGGTKFFAAAGGLEGGGFGFVSDSNSQQWSVCDDAGRARDFIRDREAGTEARAVPITKPWEEGMKFMRKYAGEGFPGDSLWGTAPSTWIKLIASTEEELPLDLSELRDSGTDSEPVSATESERRTTAAKEAAPFAPAKALAGADSVGKLRHRWKPASLPGIPSHLLW